MILALISCTKTKADHPCTAREMYWPSELFRGAYETALSANQRILILSALYGLLLPEMVIEPYDVTLKGKVPFTRRRWAAEAVFGPSGILTYIKPGDEVVSYLGKDYAQYVVGFLRGRGYTVHEPLKGLKQGARLHWFAERRRSA